MEQLLTLVVDFSVLHAICHSSRNPSVPLVSRYRSQRKITTDRPPQDGHRGAYIPVAFLSCVDLGTLIVSTDLALDLLRP
jgi:hypothetical protein